MPAPALADEFAREVRDGLGRGGQKTLPCRYLYDALGSALFEAITCLPEYGLTRADARILRRHARAIAEELPPNVVVAELGSGSGAKTRPLLEALGRRQNVTYYPIDVSPAALARCTDELRAFGTVVPLESSYLDGLRQVAARHANGETLAVLFLGSTIGNFAPEAAVDFLWGIHECLRAGDFLLLGTDLVKPAELLLAAYDDPTGVTAAFNLNLLARINRELDANFNLRQFAHLARYDPDTQRIEMHLRSLGRQTVRVRKAELAVEFEAGETIFTEACHKFQPAQVADMAWAAGFRTAASWTDCEWPFAETLLRAV